MVYIRRKGKWFHFFIPKTDVHGRIPLPMAAERLIDVADGDREGRTRRVSVDFLETAKIRAQIKSNNPRHRAQVYRWWLHPNESDIRELDDQHSDLYAILGKGRGKRKRHIILMGGTEQQREDLKKHIDQAFTVKEKKLLAGTLIKIEPAGFGCAGWYSQSRDPNTGELYGAPVICIDPQYTDESGVVVHEVIHNLRDHDKSRKGGLKHVKNYRRPRDRDLEESMTEAETRSRQRPFQPESAGYYGFIKDKEGKSQEELQTEDRITINAIDLKKHTPELKNKKGKRAINATRKNYPKTHIARMKMKGEAEAVDSFYEAEKRDGIVTHIHTRQPRGSKALDRAEQREIKQGAKALYEWRDGKKVRIA